MGLEKKMMVLEKNTVSIHFISVHLQRVVSCYFIKLTGLSPACMTSSGRATSSSQSWPLSSRPENNLKNNKYFLGPNDVMVGVN